MDTELLYLTDSYLKELEARIIETAEDSNNRWQIVLDQTIFYPKGGGQSTDQGFLRTENWEGRVYQALLKGDKLIHYVEGSSPPPLGTLVRCTLDWDRRYLNMRLHSAGHVIDFAMYLLGYSPKLLVPFKAEHSKKPVIYYEGVIDEDFRDRLEKESNDLIARNLRFSCRFIPYEELERETIYLQPGLPKNKPLRLLTLENVGSVADGGTQVMRTGEVGEISILSIERREDCTLVHYRLV